MSTRRKDMKRIVVTIFVILIVLISFNVYATEENKIESNTVKEEKQEETPTETAKNEIMYVQERCNIRSSYSAESDRLGGLDAGTEVTVIAEYSNGWYKIKYYGKEAYIKSSILGNTKPEDEETENEEQVEETNQENTPTSPEENTQESEEGVSAEDAELINEIGVLPEVGKNIADYLYIGTIIISVLGIVYVKYKL